MVYGGSIPPKDFANKGNKNDMEDRKMTNKEYKEMLINNIMEWQTRNQFTREQLEKKTIMALEIIHDNVD